MSSQQGSGSGGNDCERQMTFPIDMGIFKEFDPQMNPLLL